MVSAAILIGGRARRFGGADKSALLVGGRTILDRLRGAVRDVSDDVMLVGGKGPEIGVPTAGVRPIADRRTDCGPLGGLDAALAAARHDRVLLLACDMPLVSPELLKVLTAQARRIDAAIAAAIVPCNERGYHPLCAVYTRACHAVVERQLADGRLRMLDLLADLAVHAVSQSALDPIDRLDTLLANVNTPGEHDRIERMLSHEL